MGSSAPPVASVSAVTKTAAFLPRRYRNACSLPHVSFRLPPMPNLRVSSAVSYSSWSGSMIVRANLSEVALIGPANDAVISATNDASAVPAALPVDESVAEFIVQVSNLIKLVNSKDIVELRMKQLDCELLIRKKEALPQPPSPPSPTYIMQPPSPAPSAYQAAAPPTPQAPTSLTALVPSTASAPSTKPGKPSLPPLKSPMAGTFYRSPGPGEPAFVKVGDKVQKGQVLCIIEAMKLMNEIEADQSGTIVEVLAEDGKPVSVDTPLFVIQP
uniref:Biotin carboxyl carrier protein of acetyl-CoA carboxylase n=1 Tax=Kalanchoe fedtschenkoi TaxID=63787 RepID=A0A7N0TYY7_KALFE